MGTDDDKKSAIVPSPSHDLLETSSADARSAWTR